MPMEPGKKVIPETRMTARDNGHKVINRDNQLISFQLNGGSVLPSHGLEVALPAGHTGAELAPGLDKLKFPEKDEEEDNML